MCGRTYRYFTGDPVVPFGHGLGYTTLAYRDLLVPPEVTLSAVGPEKGGVAVGQGRREPTHGL